MSEKEWLAQVRKALARRGTPVKAVAQAAGLSDSYVSRLLNGERKMSARMMLKLAELSGVPLPASGGKGDDAGQGGDYNSTVTPRPGRLIKGKAIIAPGTWREGVFVPNQVAVPASPDPRFTSMEQYWVQIEARPTEFMICAPYFALRARPLDGDLVHVKRTRTVAGRLEREDTLRRVRVFPDRIELRIDGAPPETAVAYPAATPAEAVEIEGLVIGRFEQFFVT